MKKNEFSSFEEEINFDALLGDGKEIVFTTLEEDFSDLNGIDHTFKLEQIGIKNEEDKNKNRNMIMWVLLGIIIAQIVFISYVFYLMVIQKTYISDTAFKYFVTGVFVNIVVLFKGIIKYLYSDDKSSLLEDIEKKIKTKIN
ncbi:MAG: hypothetical protein ACRDAT_07990 [Cetobacterium sp.]